MHTTIKSVIILCLISTYRCNTGDKSQSEYHQEIRHDRSTAPPPTAQPPNKPIYNNVNSVGRTPSSILGEALLQSAAGHEAAGNAGEHCNDDIACLTLASQDRIGLDAIRTLHRQLDDDANGNIDLSESDDFLREELKYDQGYERRQQVFHQDDMHISVRELWEAWIRSEVHNWTVEQTTEWLAVNVQLPQYIPNFIQHRVTGATLPRLAVNNMHYLNNILGIKDPIHKQKIALKAMDVVLFGAPKDYNNYVKDLILVTLLLGALMSCWYAYYQNKNSQRHLHRMMKDMEGLHNAEQALDHLQKELERAKIEQESVATEKQNLERRLLEQGNDQLELRTSYSDLEVSQLKAEIELLRGELLRAEGELEDRCWSPPVGLQQWLQLTHEIENKAYVRKKMGAEKQLQQAREACEKLRKKRSSLVGAFVSTHGKSIDEVDRSIVEARTSLNEVTTELQERVHRWKLIETLCGFNVINNNGLQYLESVLYRNTSNGRGLRGRMSSSQDDLDDDTSSVYAPSAALESLLWKGEPADSSGSETGKQEVEDDQQPETKSLAGNVQFTVGGESWVGENGNKHPKTYNNGAMVRSCSQDISNTVIHEEQREISPNMTQSQSETCLDSSTARGPNSHRVIKKIIREQSTAEDETCSTDSNSTVDTEELRRKKRKLFPTFARKSKGKTS